jgi:hypothetical protein
VSTVVVRGYVVGYAAQLGPRQMKETVLVYAVTSEGLLNGKFCFV